jgi:Leucine-rich repeat (LRR) protein
MDNKTETYPNVVFLFDKADDKTIQNLAREVKVTCSRMAFLPPKVFVNVTEFEAKNVSLEEISVETFEHADRLEVLVLSFNKIKEMVGGPFKNGSRLQTLELEHNQIASLDSHSFPRTTSNCLI